MLNALIKTAFQKNRTLGIGILFGCITLFSVAVYFLLVIYFQYLVSGYELQYEDRARTYLEKRLPEYLQKSRDLIEQEFSFIESDLNVLQGISESFLTNQSRFKELFRKTQQVSFLKNKKIPKQEELKKLKDYYGSFVVSLEQDEPSPEQSVSKYAAQTALLDIYVPLFLQQGSGSRNQSFAFVDNQHSYARVYGLNLTKALFSDRLESPFISSARERIASITWFNKTQKKPLLFLNQKNSVLSFLHPVSTSESEPYNKFVVIRNDLSEIKQVIEKLEFNGLGFAFLVAPDGKSVISSGKGGKNFLEKFNTKELGLSSKDKQRYLNFSGQEYLLQRVDFKSKFFLGKK